MSGAMMILIGFIAGSGVSGGILYGVTRLMGYEIQNVALVRPYALILAGLVTIYVSLQHLIGGTLTLKGTTLDFGILGCLVSLAWFICALFAKQIVRRTS